jgi:hypothetical protein
MGIAVMWDNEQHTTLLYAFHDPWDWGDYDEAMRQGARMLDSASQKVAVIVDFTETHTLPPGALKHMRATAEQLHPRQGALVIVGANPFIQAIGGILTRLYPQQSRELHNVKTLRQARAHISHKPWILNLIRNLIYR